MAQQWTDTHTQRMTALRAGGFVAKEIAEELGFSVGTVKAKTRAQAAGLGLRSNKHEWSGAEIKYLREVWLTQKSASEIGREMRRVFGVKRTKNSVVGQVHRLGLQNRRPSPKAMQPIAPVEPLDIALPKTLPTGCLHVTNARRLPGEPFARVHYCGASTAKGSAFCDAHNPLVKVDE